MDKLEQAAKGRPTPGDIEAMWSPSLVRKYPERALEVMTRLAALPEEPDPAVIAAMAEEIGGHWEDTRMHEGVWREHWCCCDSGEDYSPEHVARATWAAMRGAMQ